MFSERDSHRIIIAGASSLLGSELKSLLEESRFAASDFHLFDEELAAGTLTEAGGEPTIIQPVEEGSFERATFVFFTGSALFTRANIKAARSSGAKIIDVSGALAAEPDAMPWFPEIDTLHGREFSAENTMYAVPSAAGTAASALALGLKVLDLRRLTFIWFQPVSEAGRAGIEELETQTSQLLSFQNVGKPVFDTQVAFALVDRFGAQSAHQLASVRERIRKEIRACLGGNTVQPAIQVLHAPVFYGTTFIACAELATSAPMHIKGKEPWPLTLDNILQACKHAGFSFTPDGQELSNVSAAGENVIQLAMPQFDTSRPEAWWIWGAADNIRFPAASAVKLAERLIP
jgi:aspartate-semialdehyde dehydrogenase